MAPFHPVFGSPKASAWRTYQVKGNLVAARARYVRERWGEAGFRDVAGRLQGEPRKLFESEVLPFAWYGFEPLATIDEAIALGPMHGDVTLMKDFGHDIARYDLSTIYKVLLKLGTPSFIIKRIGTIYSTYMRGGSATPEEVTSQSARVVFTNGAVPMYFCTHGMSGWFTAALELSGGKAVKVTESACLHRGDRRCEWTASWS